MKALLIDILDWQTGSRAGGIKATDPNLKCIGQDLGTPGKEIRIVKNGNTKPYENIKGITILNGKAAINAAIDTHIPTQYAVKDIHLLVEHMKEKKISLDTLVGKSMQQIAQESFVLKLAGVEERKPKKVK